MNKLLAWLEQTGVGLWVSTSEWGYGATLAGHGVGMAIVVGLTAVIALRILGFPASLSIAGLRALLPVLWAGLVLNALTGIALFMAKATDLFYNIAFDIKIVMIFAGVILICKIDKHVLKPAMLSSGNSPSVSQGHKIMAVSAIFIWWFSVVLSGRLIAYIIYL